jgi:uncharacterized protein YjbJ (UPF0337 family)
MKEFMNNELFKGNWNQFKGKIKEKWGKLTDDEITQINGKRDQLLGRLQKRYGWEKERAEAELKRFEDSLEEDTRKYNREYFREEGRGGEQRGYSDTMDDEDNQRKRKVK